MASPFILCVLIISALNIFGFVPLNDYGLETPFFILQLNDLLVVVILIIGIIIPLLNGRFRRVRMFGPLLLFVGYAIFLIILSINRGAPYRNAIRLSFPIIYLLISAAITAIITGKKELNLTFRLLWYLILLSVAAVAFQSLTGYAPDFAQEPGSLSYVYQTEFGLYRTYNPSTMLVIFGFCLSYAILLHNFSLRVSIVFALCLVTLVLSYSRVIYLAMLTILGLGPLWVFRNQKIATIYRVPLTIIVLLLIFYSDIGNIFSERLATLFGDIEFGGGTYGQRVELTNMAYGMLAENGQLLLGFGFSHILDVDVLRTSAEEWGRSTALLLSLNSGADTGWVSIVFRTGIIGIILFLYFLFAIFKELLGKYQAEKDLTLKAFLCAGVLFICYGCIYNFAGNFFLSSSQSIVVAALLGLAEAVPGSNEVLGSRHFVHNPCLKPTSS